MEDLEWKLQLKESEVAHAYKEVDEVKNGNAPDLGQEVKLARLLKDEAVLANAILEQDLSLSEKMEATQSTVDELLRRLAC